MTQPEIVSGDDSHLPEVQDYLASIHPPSEEHLEIEAELYADFIYDYDAFNKCAFFKPYHWCNNEDFNIAAQNLYKMLAMPKSYKADVLLSVVKIILLNLKITLEQFDVNYWTVYSRDKNKIDVNKRYRENGISHHYLTAIIDRLIELDLIDHKIGYYDRREIPNKNTSFLSRMRPKEKMRNEFIYGFPLAYRDLQPYPEQEFIELRSRKNENGRKFAIGYIDTPKRWGQRKVMASYNALLYATDIKHTDPELEQRVLWASKLVRRVFNNGVFIQGGRFYGGWWQSIKSKSRADIIINGNPVVELDFKALHPFMLYQIEGLTWPDGFDPYTLPQYGNRSEGEQKKIRNLCKEMLLIWINADDEKEALHALRDSIDYDRATKAYRFLHNDDAPDLQELIAHFKKHNLDIANKFFTGEGIKLQYRDSNIAEHIIKTMTKQNKAILSMHDGFICEAQYEDELRELMTQAYCSIMAKDKAPIIEREFS